MDTEEKVVILGAIISIVLLRLLGDELVLELIIDIPLFVFGGVIFVFKLLLVVLAISITINLILAQWRNW